MKLKDQVCSLESAKKLKELGVKQDSLWYWETLRTTNYVLSLVKGQGYSAFTVAELGEMLPKKTYINHHQCALHLGINGANNEYWYVAYKPIQTLIRDHEIRFINEAEARAKILIYLFGK